MRRTENIKPLSAEVVKQLKVHGYKSFVCLGCREGDDNQDYYLIPSKFEIDGRTPDNNMIDDHALLNFGSNDLADMIAGDEFITFVVQMPENILLQ